MGIRIAMLALAAAGLVAALYWSQRPSGPYQVSGFIEADEIRLGSRIGGRVARVLAAEGERVTAGQPLIELEPFDLGERRAEAAAAVDERRAQRDLLRAGFRPEEVAQARARRDRIAARAAELEHGPRPQEIAAARARVDQAVAQLDLAKVAHERDVQLLAERVVTTDDVDRSATELRTAEATLAVRKEELALLEEGTREEEIAAARADLAEAEAALGLAEDGYRDEEVARAEAALLGAEATLRAVDLAIAELTVRAPIDGVVEALDLRPGDLVSANAPVASLLDPARLWVRAYVPENRLDVELDRMVDVSTDSFPGETFRGRITFVARSAEFTPSNVQTPEERSKQVFRIKVTMETGLDRLRPGMAADVRLDGAAP